MTRLRGETGLISKNLLIAILFFGSLGILLIDGGSVLFARVQLNDLAEQAAIEGASAWSKSHDRGQAYQAAAATVREQDPNAAIDQNVFFVDPRTSTVTLTLIKTASTVFIQHIPPLKKFGELRVTASATPPAL